MNHPAQMCIYFRLALYTPMWVLRTAHSYKVHLSTDFNLYKMWRFFYAQKIQTILMKIVNDCHHHSYDDKRETNLKEHKNNKKTHTRYFHKEAKIHAAHGRYEMLGTHAFIHRCRYVQHCIAAKIMHNDNNSSNNKKASRKWEET